MALTPVVSHELSVVQLFFFHKLHPKSAHFISHLFNRERNRCTKEYKNSNEQRSIEGKMKRCNPHRATPSAIGCISGRVHGRNTKMKVLTGSNKSRVHTAPQRPARDASN